MRNITGYMSTVFSAACLLFMNSSCNNNAGSKTEEKDTVKTTRTVKAFTKPPGTYPDTLTINYPAAVFYQPDSLQLSRIKATADTMFYESSMHEYFYQVLTARKLLKRTWPWLKIIESKNYRFLLFINKNNTRECIDLDTKNDSHGLFVFDGKKAPIMVDMTNTETQVSFYLQE